MAALTWDGTGTRFYEMGTKKGVLYPYNTAQTKYGNGVAWNGLTAVTESPSGAEATDLWADDIKYGTMRSAEDYSFTIEAYTYPPEFGPCDGSAEAKPGVFIGQQPRTMFGCSWVTSQGNDVNPIMLAISCILCGVRLLLLLRRRIPRLTTPLTPSPSAGSARLTPLRLAAITPLPS